MTDFTNTFDIVGDEALTNSIIDRSIAEIKDGNVINIGAYAFRGCEALTTVEFPAVTSIGDTAFRNCKALTTAEFPVATSIGNSTFDGCSNLTTVNFPAVISLGSNAFKSCSKLTTVNFPAVISLGSNAFQFCSNLTTAEFPVATSIGIGGFYNCKALTTLILRSETMVTLSDTGAFNYTPIKSGTGYIYVPRALVDSYKTATNWSTYAAQFRALEDYTVDGTITGELDSTKI